MNDRLPIIEQLHGADSDRARAAILLRCPDSVLLKYEAVFLDACRRFPAGEYFVLQRVNATRAVRSEVGGLPGGLALELDTLRAELAAYAAGARIEREPGVGGAQPLWPLDAPQPAPARPPTDI